MTPSSGPVCEDCVAEGVTNWRQPVQGAARNRCYTHDRKFRAAQRKRSHDKHVGRTYGLAPGEYDELCAFQDGLCAICRRAKCVGVSGKHLAVDHDHVSGSPRGLLCVVCNREVVGKYDIEALQRAIDYLQDSPYDRMLRLR